MVGGTLPFSYEEPRFSSLYFTPFPSHPLPFRLLTLLSVPMPLTESPNTLYCTLSGQRYIRGIPYWRVKGSGRFDVGRRLAVPTVVGYEGLGPVTVGWDDLGDLGSLFYKAPSMKS
ncbi:hypothetical protein NMY22_g6898 [Coprinellus aureogranulatus]|nr:hypothetical protein NMY22_g6898 [Coprinellus aureogranulatus]